MRLSNRPGPCRYAVHNGRRPGVYASWHDCSNQVTGYRGAVYKSFPDRADAESFAEHGRGGASSAGRACTEYLATARQQFKVTHSARPPPRATKVSDFRNPYSTASHHMYVYFDGGSRGNPGPSGCGAAVFDTDPADSDDPPPLPLTTSSANLGHTTNNVAEYQGLILGLQLALRQGARHVTVRGDSKLVINQVQGAWQAHNETLQGLVRIVRDELLPQFDGWSAHHVYRRDNSVADGLANDAMDLGARATDSWPSERRGDMVRGC